jgi:hypothetical protein
MFLSNGFSAAVNPKSKNIPTEQFKKVLLKEQIELCGYVVRYEIWAWEGCLAECLIFDNDEIGGLNDQEIETLVKTLDMIKYGIDMSFHRMEDFTFVIFNFQVGKVKPFKYDNNEK